MLKFIKEIFTWWNRQTLSTRIHTSLYGAMVGEDDFGNIYYTTKKNEGVKRWVIYNGYADSSKVPAAWHSWLHHVTDSVPNNEIQKKSWHKNHLPNLTGTDLAYKPPGSLSNTSKTLSENKHYTSWDPSSSENEK
tara:strand:- start:95 stop:499 length:405 start_codon:yes stop_codon:yes gene_type:complete